MKVLPVILGTDNNAYGVARSFHEQYGWKSLALGKKALSQTQASKIVDVEITPNFDIQDVFMRKMQEVADRYRRSETVLLLISCSDGYTGLLTRNQEELAKDYRFNYIDAVLQQKLENKQDFYRICEQYHLDYPKTYVISFEQRDTSAMQLTFPVALKPDDSIVYTEIHFEGKKKAYKIETQEELDRTIGQIYATDYRGDLIIQDFIPGDFSKMYVLNAYVNRRGQVKMMCFGKCLLDECLPTQIGNYNALVTIANAEIYAQYEDFLTKIGYRGFANFDLKFDERDGKFKVFEINIRQGRSSFYMTAGGCNFTRFLVEDLVEDRDLPTHYHAQSALWLYVDPQVLRKYHNPADAQLVSRQLKQGFAFTQWYKKDRSLRRWLNYMRRRLSTRRYYPKLQPGRDEKEGQ